MLGGLATARGATSDELCGTVLSTSAGDTGTAVAVGVATGGHTALLVAPTAIVAATAARQALRIIVTITADLAEEPAVARAFFVTIEGTADVTRAGLHVTNFCSQTRDSSSNSYTAIDKPLYPGPATEGVNFTTSCNFAFVRYIRAWSSFRCGPQWVCADQIVELEFHVVLWLGVRVSART